MAKTSQEIERQFIGGLKNTTGKTLHEWMSAIKTRRIKKRNDLIKWLKRKNNFGHLNASLLAGIYFNNGSAVYDSERHLLDKQIEKCPDMRPMFDHLQKEISDRYKDVVFMAKKTYVSIAKKREFAAINIKKGEIQLGMDLGDIPFEGIVQKAKLTGSMPKISHMVVIKNHSDINKSLFKLLETAHKRVNP